MALIYIPRDCQIGIAEQTVWGTAAADAAAVIQLDCEPINIPQSVNLRQNNGATGARWRITTDFSADQYGAMPEFSIKGEAKRDEIDFFLAGYFQKVVEGATTPFAKTFTFDTSAPQPDFPLASAGYTMTFFFRDPVAADSWKVKDVVVKSLKLSYRPGERVGYEATLVGRGAPATSTPSGTWTRSANEFYFWNTIARKTVNFGAGALAQILGQGGIDLTLEQIVESYGQESTGEFTGYVLRDRFPKLSMNITKGTSLATAITNLKAATAVDINIGIGNATPGTDDGDFDIAAKMILQPDVERIFGDHYEVNLVGEVASANNSTTPMTIVMANAIDRVW